MPNKENHNPDNEHSQEKLRIYSAYLFVYLAILFRTPQINHVNIYDMMAGQAFYPKSRNGGEVKGSAALAVDIVKKIKEKFPTKTVHLYLNDIEAENIQSLRKYTKGEDWVHCQNKDVNEAIFENLENPKADKNLFYLDPYGYTQIKKESVDAIVGKTENECLLFVPVTRIVQFIKKKEPIEGQEKCIADFLTEYNINIVGHKNTQWDEWGKIIKDGLRKSYCESYVGMAKLQTKKANNYALYFIGNHIYGLDKFSEIVKKIQMKIRQRSLFPPDNPELISYLSQSRTNRELYEYMLMEGWSCSSAAKLLKGLEKEDKISVEVLPTAEVKRKTSFYLSYRDYKASPKISVRVKEENNHDIWD